MNPTRLSDFFPLALQSLTQPKVTLRKVLNIPVARPDLVTAGWLVIVLGLLLSQFMSLVLQTEPSAASELNVMVAGVVLAVIGIFGGAILLHRVGISFNGNTNFDDCLKTVIWLNFVILLLQIPIPLSNAHSAETFSLVTLAVVTLTMLQITAMVMELHGFTKVMPVLLGVIGAQFLFGDGSVHFLSENIDHGTYNNLGAAADGNVVGEF